MSSARGGGRLPLVQGSGLPGDPVVTHDAVPGVMTQRPSGLDSQVVRRRPEQTQSSAASAKRDAGPEAPAETDQTSESAPPTLRPASWPFAPEPPRRNNTFCRPKFARNKVDAFVEKMNRRVEERAQALAAARLGAKQEYHAAGFMRALVKGRRLSELVSEHARRRTQTFAPLSPERRVLADAIVWAEMQLDALRTLDYDHGVAVERVRRVVELAERVEKLVERERRRAAESERRRLGSVGKGDDEGAARPTPDALREWLRT